MAVRTDRLFGPSVGSLTGVNVYTVPSGRTARILTIRIVNGGITTAGFAFYLNSAIAANLLGGGNVAVGAALVDTGVLVLEEGESLIFVATNVNSPISGHGSLLLGTLA